MMTPDKAVRLFYMLLGDAVVTPSIRKPISWALYRTWKVFDMQEVVHRADHPEVREAIQRLDEAEQDYYISTEYLQAIRMAKEALIEKEASDAGNNNSNQ